MGLFDSFKKKEAQEQNHNLDTYTVIQENDKELNNIMNGQDAQTISNFVINSAIKINPALGVDIFKIYENKINPMNTKQALPYLIEKEKLGTLSDIENSILRIEKSANHNYQDAIALQTYLSIYNQFIEGMFGDPKDYDYSLKKVFDLFPACKEFMAKYPRGINMFEEEATKEKQAAEMISKMEQGTFDSNGMPLTPDTKIEDSYGRSKGFAKVWLLGIITAIISIGIIVLGILLMK